MGRVEIRRYKQKRRYARRLRIVMVLLLVLGGVVLIWRRIPPGFIADHLPLPSATPITSSFDRTVETREVTLAEETWYAIQTGVFSTQEAAEQKADAYTQRGAPGVVVQEGEKWRVFIACYGTEEEASAVRARLETNQRVDTYLYAWRCPELRLRLSGMAGQLDAVEAGFTLLISSAAALRDTAISLDAAQLTADEALAAVAAQESQINLWEETVRNRFGRSIPELVEGMLKLTDNGTAACLRLQDTQGATALSAALKKEAMGLYEAFCVWRSAVAAQ